MPYQYRVHGLCISSEIELPELVADGAWELPDVRIRLGMLPELGSKSDELFADGEIAGFVIEGVAQYRVNAGREIVVDPCRDAPIRNVRLYLLGSAFGLLLHQRGCLPLHANAVEIEGRGYAFMGPSGSGKSTLAAAFHDEGYKIVADDVCVVGIEPEGQAVAHGGIPRLRLWEDALAASGRTSADHQLSYAGDEQFRKFDVPTGKDMAAPVPLSAIFELVPGEPMSCERLAGLEAVEAVFANTYRGGFVLSAGDPTQHWQACLKLVSSVPVYRLRRPVNPESTARIIAQLTESIPVPPC